MSGGACQKAAQQANDVLAQQAKRDEDCGCGGGCAPAPALGKRDASRPKKGSNRRGPGCKNADCNACAEQADEVMNAVAGFSDGIPEFSFADVQRARLLAGFRPGVGSVRGAFSALAPAGAPVPPAAGASGVPWPWLGSSTECVGDCLEVDPVAACGNSATDPTNSKWPVGWPGLGGVGDWTPTFHGGCEREVECADYSASCSRTEWTNATGACVDAGNSREASCGPGAWTGWVFTPTDSDGSDGCAGGECVSTWTCVGSDCGSNKGGVACADSVQYGNAGGTDRSTWVVKQTCGGTQTAGVPYQLDEHAVDDETAPTGWHFSSASAGGIGTGFFAAGVLGSSSAMAEDWSGFGQGCVVNNYQGNVQVWSDAGGDEVVPPNTSTDCRALGGQDIDHVQNPVTGAWYKITRNDGGGYWTLNYLPTATVNPTGTVTGDVCLAIAKKRGCA